jgi:hypothetical protein
LSRGCNPLDIEMLEVLCQANQPDASPQRAGELVGAWLVTFSPAYAKDFIAVLTFHADGTAAGATPQSADFGVWNGSKGEYDAAMYAFTPDGNPASRRRIRIAVHIAKPDFFQAEFAIDRIAPDGTTTRSVASGTAYARKITLSARTIHK